MRGHALADVQLRTAVVYTAAPEALPSRRSAPLPLASLASLAHTNDQYAADAKLSILDFYLWRYAGSVFL